MDDTDEAARRTAINLMRLNEALEMEDADGYSSQMTANGITKREARRLVLSRFYRRWFMSQGDME